MKHLCRCCLKTDSRFFCSIHQEYRGGPTYAEFLRQIADVEIEENDNLPQEICCECFNKVRSIIQFGCTTRKSDEQLRIQLKSQKPQIRFDEDSEIACGDGDDEMKNLQHLENEYFSRIEDGANDSQECVLEEILEQDSYYQDNLVVEEIHDGEEIHIVEEILEIEKVGSNGQEKKCLQNGDLLVELAHVAATQKNAIVFQNQNQIIDEEYYPEDENDDDYLIEFDSTEILDHDFKPPKWKCGECKLILRGDVSYEGHMNMHKQLRPHKCLQCTTEFRCRTALKKHREKRHTSDTDLLNSQSVPTQPAYQIHHDCLECKQQFDTEMSLYEHEVIAHDKYATSTTCKFCSNIVVENLLEHIQTFHCNGSTICEETSSETWECYECSKVFETLEILESHHTTCHQRLQEQNSQDIKVEYEEVSITNTALVETVEYAVQCEICKRVFQRKNLAKHMELHKRKDKEKEKEVQKETKKYLCSSCPREFKNSKSLHQHEKIHDGEGLDLLFVCGDCGRQYVSELLLETHRKQAHKERDNICNICGNAFKLKNQLVNHMKLHLEKNIQCPHCDKKYARQFDLNVHLRSHTGELPYACHLCDKRFAIKVRLTYHLQKHYGIKHQCKECGSEFNSRQKLKAHSFKHTGMPYRCELCDDHGFATRIVFKRHLNRVHHATMSEESLNEMFQQNTGKSVKIKQINETIEPSDIEENENVVEDIIEEKSVVLSSDIFMETEVVLP